MEVIRRNGISQQNIAAGYFLRDPSFDLTAGEREADQSLGIAV